VDPGRDWLDSLGDEDLAFIRRFVLASGSLKEMARLYGVSYPTVRLRLDRLIEKMRALEDPAAGSELERVARAHFAEGKLDVETLKSLLRAHARDRSSSGGSS
jgi:hypothetical protein